MSLSLAKAFDSPVKSRKFWFQIAPPAQRPSSPSAHAGPGGPQTFSQIKLHQKVRYYH
eukprot:UN27824